MPSDDAVRPDSGLWKDALDARAVAELGSAIARVYGKFDAKAFAEAVVSDGYLDRELKDRTRTIARHLKTFLPHDFRRACDILIKTAPTVAAFENWALTSYVEQFGLDKFEISVATMRELTSHSTCEFAIRPFMNRYTDRMIPVLHAWAADDDEHVRRLAAEGSRPRGVWTAHITAFREDPAPVIELLEKLKADESLYVRKAVANNLNDISKDHPEVVIETALRWKKDRHHHTDWIIKHACRSLIRAGHPRVFPVFGLAYPARVKVHDLAVKPKRVKIGKDLSFAFTLTSTGAKKQKLAVDYKIHFVKANGTTAPKLFKLSEKTIQPGESIRFESKRSFENRSTRTHRPGRHRLEIVVNGDARGSVDFIVTT
ncbi:DNA alkylation repair protein [candidate division GN15 bacterium]|nr:DNA alkylation repair protein [candidate division GN15 bacterium]